MKKIRVAIYANILLLSLAACNVSFSQKSEENNTSTGKQKAVFTNSASLPVLNTSTGLCEVLPHSDTALIKASYNTFNRMQGYEVTATGSQFCVDDTTGVIYFVNQNNNNYIYRIKDGVAAPAVSIPATYLYTHNGSVYFTAYTYGKKITEITNGDIYCYTPSTGSIELVYSTGINISNGYKFKLDNNGLYIKEPNKINWYYLAYNSDTLVEDTERVAPEGWLDYELGVFRYPGDDVSTLPPLSLAPRHPSVELKAVKLDIGRPDMYCVKENTLYYAYSSSETIGVLQLDGLIKKEYDLSSIICSTYEDNGFPQNDLTSYSQSLNSFVVTENDRYIWATTGRAIYKIDTLTESTDVWVQEQGYLQVLYTDGKNIYGLYTQAVGALGYIGKINTNSGLTSEISKYNIYTVQPIIQ